ncbi:MAG: ABC transporter substrate-binding protein, partial [Egibacteraceae bacterium]
PPRSSTEQPPSPRAAAVTVHGSSGRGEAPLEVEEGGDPALLGNPTEIIPSGPLRVDVVTPEPYAHFFEALASDGFPVYDAEAVQEAQGDFASLLGQGIFTAPYMMTEVSPRGASYEHNEDYWLGMPALAGISVGKIADDRAGLQALANGEADLLLNPQVRTAAQASNLENVHFLTSGELMPGYIGFNFNPNLPPFDDLAVRQAFSFAIDNDAIAQSALFGVLPPMRGIFPSGQPLSFDWVEYDPDRAEQLLESAGWVSAGGGPRTKAGTPLTAVLWTLDDNAESIATAAAGMLEAVGFAVDLRVQPPMAYEAVFAQLRDVGGALVTNANSYGAGKPAVAMPRNFLADDPHNGVPIVDEAINAEIERIAASNDPAVVGEALRTIQRINAEQVYYHPVVGLSLRTAAGERFSGFQVNPFYFFIDWRTVPT